MPNPQTVLVGTAVFTLIVAAAAVYRRQTGRVPAASAAVLALVLTAAAVWIAVPGSGFLQLDSLGAAPSLLVCAVAVALLLAGTAADTGGRQCAAILLCLAGTLLVYTGETPALMLIGILLSTVPFLAGRPLSEAPLPRLWVSPGVMLGASVVLFAASVLLLQFFSQDPRAAMGAFVLITISALIRNAVFPFHSWLVLGVEKREPLPYALLLAGQSGAFLIARLALPLLQGTSQPALTAVSSLALVGTLLTAVTALGETAPRRVLGLLAVSQSGFVFSGLENRNVEGIAGALLHWLVMSAAIPGLLLVLRCLEARYGRLPLMAFAGFGARVPRLAVFFLLFGLALVGIPGTLGFCAEDLLFHGALEAHPLLGLALPIATALSAIRMLNLFSSLFLGRSGPAVPHAKDALPRERWPLTAGIGFLVIAGLLPGPFVHSRVRPATFLSHSLSGAPVQARPHMAH